MTEVSGSVPVCRVLELSPSTYFARRKRPKSARRITRVCCAKGVDVARSTVERLMAELGLEGVIRGQRRRTTVPEPSAPRPPDLVDRDFTASRPDQLWVVDMAYVRTWTGSPA
ncbi:IS3 family transposase [Streptomyces shenzhenensis]|uniref:IS3 family transposase n=1 Tax=Streptomyces shenzhenensis TaxID=943815 RepID=UPI0033EE41C3